MKVISKDIIDCSLTNVLHIWILVSDVVINDLRGHTLTFIHDQCFLHCSDLLKLFLVFAHLFVELRQVNVFDSFMEISLLKENIEGIKVQV